MKIFSPLAGAGLCDTIGSYIYLFKRLTIVIRAGVQSGLPRDSKTKHGRIQRIHNAHRNGRRSVLIVHISRSDDAKHGAMSLLARENLLNDPLRPVQH